MDGQTNTAGRSNQKDPARQALLANRVPRANQDVPAAPEFRAACALSNCGGREPHTE